MIGKNVSNGWKRFGGRQGDAEEGWQRRDAVLPPPLKRHPPLGGGKALEHAPLAGRSLLLNVQ